MAQNDVVAGLLHVQRLGLEVCPELTHMAVRCNYRKYDVLMLCRCCVIDLGWFRPSVFLMCLCWFVQAGRLVRARACLCTIQRVC